MTTALIRATHCTFDLFDICVRENSGLALCHHRSSPRRRHRGGFSTLCRGRRLYARVRFGFCSADCKCRSGCAHKHCEYKQIIDSFHFFLLLFYLIGLCDSRYFCCTFDSSSLILFSLSAFCFCRARIASFSSRTSSFDATLALPEPWGMRFTMPAPNVIAALTGDP